MIKWLKIGATIAVSGIMVVCLTSNNVGKVFAVPSSNQITNYQFAALPKSTDNMSEEEKLAYFQNIYKDKQVEKCPPGTVIDYQTESDVLAKKADVDYPLNKANFTALPKPTDNMSEEEKLAYFQNIYGNNAKSGLDSSGNGNIPIMSASAPTTSDFYNLSSSDYNGSGSFTANYLYSLKCFAPNSSNNLIIRGTGSAAPATYTMYISMYDVTTRTAGTEFAINYKSIAYDNSSSYFDYSFAVGPLNPNHLYAVRFSPQDAYSAHNVYFTVSHS